MPFFVRDKNFEEKAQTRETAQVLQSKTLEGFKVLHLAKRGD
jgi:hypothetical protein